MALLRRIGWVSREKGRRGGSGSSGAEGRGRQGAGRRFGKWPGKSMHEHSARMFSGVGRPYGDCRWRGNTAGTPPNPPPRPIPALPDPGQPLPEANWDNFLEYLDQQITGQTADHLGVLERQGSSACGPARSPWRALSCFSPQNAPPPRFSPRPPRRHVVRPGARCRRRVLR